MSYDWDVKIGLANTLHCADTLIAEFASHLPLAACTPVADWLNLFPELIETLRTVREECPGIHTTNQGTGETFADTIDALLAKVGG